ncbi:hypothetical protein B0T16DRAFT_392179 [Cercophora newfieldiana]|uniref:Ankyrin n=1 Tax=Cercophora newfieldiana TaxID=92897 RepID=A0AA39Y0G0_9PEZI|nr:hypothetical protein B0T16DRAFT_392179 [Cercophora newfieldiana]
MTTTHHPNLTPKDKTTLFLYTNLGSWILLHSELNTIATRETSTPAHILTTSSLSDSRGWSLLHYAIARLASSLLALSKSHPDISAHQDWVNGRMALQGGEDAAYQGRVSRETPLHIAIRVKDIAGVRKLIEYGARLDIPNGEGKSALVLAREGLKEAEWELEEWKVLLGLLL